MICEISERHVRHSQRELSAEDAAGAEHDLYHKLYDKLYKLCQHMLALVVFCVKLDLDRMKMLWL